MTFMQLLIDYLTFILLSRKVTYFIVEETNATTDATLATPETKVFVGATSVGKKTPGRAKVLASRKSAGSKTAKSGKAAQEKGKGAQKREEAEEAKDSEIMKLEEPSSENVEGSAEYEGTTMESREPAIAGVRESVKEEKTVVEHVGESTRSEKIKVIGMEGIHEIGERKQTFMEVEVPPVAIVGDTINQEESVVVQINKSSHNEHSSERKAAELNEQPEEERNVNNQDCKSEAVTKEINIKDKMGEGALTEHEKFGGDEALEDYEDSVDYEDHGEDYSEEPAEEGEALEEEHRELTALAKARRIKKEHEIFVGGLDRDATEEDPSNIGEYWRGS